MRSEQQAQASRENGAKSNGPVTDEGRKVSSQNASLAKFEQKYGITPVQSDSQFALLLDQLMDDLKPAGIMQGILVERLAHLIFKIRRLAKVETLFIKGEIDYNYYPGKRRDETIKPYWDPEMVKLSLELIEEREQETGQSIREYLGSFQPPTPEHEYAHLFVADQKALDRLQNYELKLQKALQASLREFRRLQKHQREAAGEEELETEAMANDQVAMTNKAGNPTSQTRNPNQIRNPDETADAHGCTRLDCARRSQMNADENDQNEPGSAAPDESSPYPRSSASIGGSNPSRADSGEDVSEENIKNEPDGDLGGLSSPKAGKRPKA
jgi:hypothetical protein